MVVKERLKSKCNKMIEWGMGIRLL